MKFRFTVNVGEAAVDAAIGHACSITGADKLVHVSDVVNGMLPLFINDSDEMVLEFDSAGPGLRVVPLNEQTLEQLVQTSQRLGIYY